MHDVLFTRSGLSLERLRTLCEVAGRGGIAKAAGGDPVAQSQFSRQLRELEGFFGVELTRRRGRNAELTEAGRELAVISREFLDALTDFSDRQRGGESQLKLGAGESLLQWLVVPRLGRLRTLLPGTLFTFRNLRGEEIVTQLQEAEIDFGILAARELPEGLASTRLGVMRYRLFVGAAALGKGAALKWQDVVQRPFVGLEGEGSQMRAIRRLAAEYDLRLKPDVLCSSLPGAAAVLEQSDGFAILPEVAARNGLTAIEAPFLRELQRTIVLAWSVRRRATRQTMPKWQRLLAEHLTWE